MNKRLSILIAGFVLGSLYFAVAANDWSQAAGSSGNFETSAAAPTEWSVVRDENIKWKLTLPETGQSSPVICAGSVFFTTMAEVSKDSSLGKDIVAWRVDAETGEVIWKRDIPGEHPLRLSGCFSDSSAPPAVCDGERVVFVNASGGIVCFDMEGKQLWRREILSVGRTLPFLHEGKFVFTRQIYPPDPDGNFPHKYKDSPKEMWTQLQALDITTGEEIWTTTCGVNMGNSNLPQRLADGRAVVVVGRGGGHGPPEKPEGVSLVDLKDGSTIWTLPLEGFMSTMSYRIQSIQMRGSSRGPNGHPAALYIFHKGEHLTVNASNGRITRRDSILENISVRRRIEGTWKGRRENIPDAGKNRMITQGSNLVVGGYHYFRAYTLPYLGRVDLQSGEVEYLELPLQLTAAVDAKDDKLLWHVAQRSNKDTPMKSQSIVENDMKNSRGFVVFGDKRSKGNGWGHVASAMPTVAGDHLYVPVMNGTVYVIKWKAGKLRPRAIASINDLGPAGKSYNRASVTFANGRAYAHTIRELICIGK